jgi:GntR family transcriptional regulator
MKTTENLDSPVFEYADLIDLHTKSVGLYHSVGHIIRSKIQSGEWEVGNRIPSERSLTEALNVSRSTVRQGIENLVKEGVLRREQGRGTFVAPPKFKQGALRLLESSDMIRESGLKPSYEVLGQEVIASSPDVSSKLNLPPHGPIIWLRRLLRVNLSPLLIETVYLPHDYFQSLAKIDIATMDLRMLFTKAGFQILRAHEVFEPILLEAAEAKQLGVEGGVPGLWVEHLVFDLAEITLAYVTVLIRGDRCRFYTDITYRSDPM